MGQHYANAKNYDAAVSHLTKVSTKVNTFNEYVKIILFRIYYERNESEKAKSILDNFRDTIRKKVVSGAYKEFVRNFYYYASKLWTIKFGSTKNGEYKVDALIAELKNEKRNIDSKKWMFRQLEGMRGGR